MESKKPPLIDKIPVSTFFIHRERYKIDITYQRESGTWSKDDEQYLIDTVLRGFSMPPIFIYENSGTDWIVDGQQRLNTIWRFKDGKFGLNEKYSSDIIKDNNKNISYDKLSPKYQNIFDTYPIPVIYLRDYDDEEIRNMFRRLQRGKKLNVGEILNAYEGEIVPTMRKLGEHKFFKEVILLKKKRYKHFHTASMLLYLEKEGIKDISPKYVYSFFENNTNLKEDSKIYQKVNRTLNYLCKAFGERRRELKKDSWIITLYLLASYLLETYAINEKMSEFKKFFLDFYQEVKNSTGSGDEELIKFDKAITAGTNSEANIKLRNEIILKRFLEKVNVNELDENRIFNDEQKISIFNRNKGKCQICGKKLDMGDSLTQYHHKEMWSEGGGTSVDKGMLVCRDCHLNVIHGSKK